jgi:hypothetical protein
MAGWGTEWGEDFFWGADLAGADWACELAQQRLLHWHPDGNLRNWMCAFAEAIGEGYDTLLAIMNGFNVDTAVGDQLDKIGSIVGLPRSGSSDTRYRTLIKIQIKLLLSAARQDANWTGTVNNVVGICREFIGETVATITLVNLPPKSFILTLPDFDDSPDLLLLLSFVTKAIYSEVLGYVLFSTSSGSRWGSDSVVIADAGKWGSDSVVIADASTWGYVHTIGD